MDVPPIFIADSAGIDFLNSIATPLEEPVDWIADGEGLIEWLRRSGLVPPAMLDELAANAMPGEMDRVADQARNLRDWFRGFVKAHMGRELDESVLRELAPLNALLSRDEGYGRIGVHTGEDGKKRLDLERVRRWRSPETLLMPIGEAIADAIAHEDFAHVKACEGHNCTLLFVDRTRNRKRRWCSMSVCGNRAKVSAHRRRAKDQ